MLFTVLMWVFAFLLYISNPKNKANVWCAVSALIFSLGPFKEFYYYDVVPRFFNAFPGSPSMETHTAVYSVITYIIYSYGAIALFAFACCFSKLDRERPRLFRLALALCFLTGIGFGVVYPPARTHFFQTTDRSFWYAYSLYNIVLGLAVTRLMLHTAYRETRTKARRQKWLICFSILPPVWFSLYAIFVVHTLQFKTYFKLWQLTTAIIGFSVLFFVYVAFREGMMGLRLTGETFKWDADMRMINKGAQYTGHVLKNETAKIAWSLERLGKLYQQDYQPEELSIIARSVDHLQHFVYKNQMYSGEIVLQEEHIAVEEIVLQAVDLTRSHIGSVQILLSGLQGVLIRGDRLHLTEMMSNLITNAAEAMSKQGNIQIRGAMIKGGKRFQITVEDTGCGISKEHLARVFEPYFTTKHSRENYGLGLAYCANVVRKHDGTIAMNSKAGAGTTVRIELPAKHRISSVPQNDPPKENPHVPAHSDIVC